jgi:hypothetical protein
MPTTAEKKPKVERPSVDPRPIEMVKEELESTGEYVSPLRDDKEAQAILDKANEILTPDNPANMPRGLYAKLVDIMRELPVVEPTGRNTHFNYSFITDKQVSGLVRPRMAQLGLIVIPDVLSEQILETVTKNGGKSFLTRLHVAFTIIDAETGQSHTGRGYGYGDDSGDKGANKAFTSAMKNWLIHLFQMGGEDIEDDPRADKRAMDRESGSAAASVGVKVEGANIEGIARGGRSEVLTGAQARQIGQLVGGLKLSPEEFSGVCTEILGSGPAVPENGDPGPAAKEFLRALSADDAGKLIQGLLELKDEAEREESARNDSPYGG